MFWNRHPLAYNAVGKFSLCLLVWLLDWLYWTLIDWHEGSIALISYAVEG